MEEEKEQPQELKSEHITLTVEHKPECVVRYVAKVDAELTKEAREGAIRSLAKEVSLPGFRKGRAPRHLIIKNFADPLGERWQKQLADTTFEACYKLTHISPLKAPISFHFKRHSATEGAEVTFVFEMEPEAPDIDIDKLTLQEVARDVVDEAAYTVALNDLRSFFGSWETLSDREVQVGDFVLVDVDIIEQSPPERALSNARFEVNKSKMAEWMFDLIIGMRIGESKKGISQVDRDAPEKERAAMPPKKVSLTLRGIEKLHLPNADDMLAQKVGLKDVGEMKEHLTMLLHKRADVKQRESYRKQICAHLDTYAFDLPRSLCLKEKQARMRPPGSAPIPGGERVEEIEIEAKKSLRYFFISRKIIAKYGISVSLDEQHRELNTPLSQIFGEVPNPHAGKKKSEEESTVALTTLMFEKATDYLISRAHILPIEPTAQQAIQEEKSVDERGGEASTMPSEADTKSEKEPSPEENR